MTWYLFDGWYSPTDKTDKKKIFTPKLKSIKKHGVGIIQQNAKVT